MADVAVIGGGPAGLSAALFTAKNGLETVVFDADETWLHRAHLYNYLGIESIDGTEFVERAREQIAEFGVSHHPAEVHAVEGIEDGFRIETADGEYGAEYVVLATGTDRDLAERLGCAFDDDETVDVGLDMETSVENVYATGGMVRAETWQAIISAGDGGAAALDILSTERGERFHDFDVSES